MKYQLTPGGSTLPAYPNRAERNPKKKTPDWIAQWGYAFVSDCLRQTQFPHWFHARSLNEERLSYVFGQQSTERYERFTEEATAESDPTGISQQLDKRILPVVPKHVRILSDKLAEQEFAPVVTVVDERAEQEKDQHLDTVRLWMQQGEWLKAAGVQPPAELPADMPKDEDDLRLYADSIYQHEDAVAMEQKLALCLANANYKQLDRDIVLHFFAFGEACVFLGVDGNGRPLPTMLQPGRVLLLPSVHEDYRDARGGAHVDYLTLGQLRAEAGDQLSAEQYKLVAQSATNATTTDWFLPKGMGDAQDMQRVTVVRFSFLSEDDRVWKTKYDKQGNPYYEPKTADPAADFRGGEITRATVTNVYEGVLIIGTDLHYNCRLGVKQLRDADNPGRGLLPYAAFTPGMLDGRSSCAMDEVKGIADFVQKNWLRLQEACLRAVPQGYTFDVEALIEATAMLKGSKGRQGLDLKKAMTMFYRTGNQVGKRRGKNGEILPSPITPTEVTGYQDIQNYWTSLRAGLQMLESIMSSNEVVSAATPNPEVSNGQSELALQGTMASLGYLAHGKRMLFEHICRAMGLRIWLTEARQPVTGTLAGAPGKAATRVKPRPELALRRFNFRIERKQTQQDRQEFRAMLQRSLDAKEITAADYTYLLEVDNIKEAWRILAQRAKRNQQQQLAQAQQNQQATIQGQIQAAQEAEKAKQGTIQVQLQADQIIKKIEGDNAARVASIYVQAQQEQEQDRNDTKLLESAESQRSAAMREALSDARAGQADPAQEASTAFSQLQPAA